MKYVKYIGIITIFLFTFVFTEKVDFVLKENDNIMIDINKNKDNYEIKVEEAIIDDNKIIPGKSGKKVDVNKSYNSMRKKGYYNFNLLNFEIIKPKEVLKDNKDKYIVSANKKNRSVSLIFTINEGTDKLIVKQIVTILNNKGISSNFFINDKFIENNNDIINEISRNHIIGNITFNDNFIWIDNVLKTLNTNNRYCFFDKENSDYLEMCNKNEDYSILSDKVIRNNLYTNIKKEINNGSLISINVNEDTLNELSTSLKYIYSKGYSIINLSEILKEDI